MAVNGSEESKTSGYATTRFRVLNERISLLVAPSRGDERLPVPFVCECHDEHCFVPVTVSIAEFEAICAGDEHRLIAPGHQIDGEQVVVETRTYAVARVAEAGEGGWLRMGTLDDASFRVGREREHMDGDARDRGPHDDWRDASADLSRRKISVSSAGS